MKVRPFVPTERDISILEDCYRNHVMSFSQIHNRHFRGRAKQTVNNRLSRLSKVGLLKRHRTGLIVLPGTSQGVGAVFQVTRSAIRKLQSEFPNHRYREAPMTFSHYSLCHDLLLNEAAWMLKKRFESVSVVNTKASRMNSVRKIPDAVLSDKCCSIALEMELTSKSEHRYREIIRAYQLERSFTSVLYIVANREIEMKLIRIISGRKLQSGLPPPSTGRFYIVSLKTLFSDPINSPITNGKQHLKLGVKVA